MRNIIKLLRILEQMSDERFEKLYPMFWAMTVAAIIFGCGFLVNALAHLLGK